MDQQNECCMCRKDKDLYKINFGYQTFVFCGECRGRVIGIQVGDKIKVPQNNGELIKEKEDVS